MNLVRRTPLYFCHVTSAEAPPAPSMRTRSVPGGTSMMAQSLVMPFQASPILPRESILWVIS
jgi:hypothetical protein